MTAQIYYVNALNICLAYEYNSSEMLTDSITDSQIGKSDKGILKCSQQPSLLETVYERYILYKQGVIWGLVESIIASPPGCTYFSKKRYRWKKMTHHFFISQNTLGSRCIIQQLILILSIYTSHLIQQQIYDLLITDLIRTPLLTKQVNA